MPARRCNRWRRRGEPFADVLLKIGPGGGQAAHFVMDRAQQDRLLLDPHVALYVHPTTEAEGFDLVVVNGQPAFEGGEAVGRAGRLLRRGG